MLHFDPDEFDDAAARQSAERISRLAGLLTDDDFERVDPPDAVWDGIVTRLRDDAVADRAADEVADRPVVVAMAAAGRRHRPRWAVPMVAAAAVAVLVGVVWSVTRSADDAGLVELAAAPLGELQGSGAGADAALVRESDGRLHVVLSNASMPPPPAGSFYEIWLVDHEVTDPRSLSHGSMGERLDFVVPAGVDPSAYPIIDVSLEPDDGNPAHAGTDHSVARGVLEL